MESPIIKKLHLHRFRGFQDCVWYPAPGMNILLGGGDVGKTTILEAIGLLLHPTNSFTLSDADYWHRDVENEFFIEAVITPCEAITTMSAMAWPWEWDEKEAVQPPAEGEASGKPAVYKIRVRGTAELDLVYELVQPDDTTISFTTVARRAIGVVRLLGDDKNDRDLRLVQGGGLDRLLADKTLRAKLGRKVALEGVEGELADDSKARLNSLDDTFSKNALPHELGLGFVGGAGLSINALVGLTSKKGEAALPLISWGSGTRRLASLQIANSLQDGTPLLLVDELERGLEPYRQRRLVNALQEKSPQSFLTTHSPAVLDSANKASLWYIDAEGTVGALSKAKVAVHQSEDPEAFLARLTIVVEGSTELGFMHVVLERVLGQKWASEGIYVSDGRGNERVLDLLEALLVGGVHFAGIADTEANNLNPDRWAKVKASLGDKLLRWEKGSIEDNLLPLFGVEHFEALLTDAEGRLAGERRKTLALRLGIDDTSFGAIKEKAGNNLMSVIIDAATGVVPDDLEDEEKKAYKRHADRWFKSVSGGVELAQKIFDLGLWGKAGAHFDPLLKAIKSELGLAA